MFQADFEVLLYDLTSTYFEGDIDKCEKAKRGYSRDSRPDCAQVVIALIVTPDGFPLAHEVMDGNTSEQKTLKPFLEQIEKTYGQAQRVWVMDRGDPHRGHAGVHARAEDLVSGGYTQGAHQPA